MELNLQAAINDPRIGGNAGVLRLANAARPSSDYLLATVLPDRNLPGYEAALAGLLVRTTMAGAVGMDSKYPEGGVVELNTFREKIAKIAIQTNLSEEALRQLQAFAAQVQLSGGDSTTLAVNTVLNFVQKLLIQPHFDRGEWLRGQALFTGAQSWDFNGVHITADYGIPAGNKLTARTTTNGYGGSASKFWDDVKAARKILGGTYQYSIARGDLVDEIIYNSVNNINVLSDSGGRVQIQRFRGSLERPSTDARETMTLIRYDAEGEILDVSNPGKTIKVPFIPKGKIGHFGSAGRKSEFIVGEGATEDPDNALALGYVHVGPTVENGGALGLWARVYTPEGMPMQLRGQSVSNRLPVITNPDKIVIGTSDFQS